MQTICIEHIRAVRAQLFSRSLISAGYPATGDPHECRKIAYKARAMPCSCQGSLQKSCTVHDTGMHGSLKERLSGVRMSCVGHESPRHFCKHLSMRVLALNRGNI